MPNYLIDFLSEIEFGYGGNEFRSCTIDSLFGKVEFQFCSGEIDIHFDEIQMEKVNIKAMFINSLLFYVLCSKDAFIKIFQLTMILNRVCGKLVEIQGRKIGRN